MKESNYKNIISLKSKLLSIYRFTYTNANITNYITFAGKENYNNFIPAVYIYSNILQFMSLNFLVLSLCKKLVLWLETYIIHAENMIYVHTFPYSLPENGLNKIKKPL